MSNIPEHAYIAFDGVLSRTRQWEQEMFDGSIAIFETVERQGTVQIFAVHEDKKILIVRQKQPHRSDRYYDFLGGRVPFGRDPLTHAQVELREESGMIAHDRSLLWEWEGGGYVKWGKHTYIAKNLEIVGEQELDPGGEIIELQAVTFETMVDMIVARELGNVRVRAQILETLLEDRLDDFKQQLFRDV